MNSMILHELFFDGFGDQSEPNTSPYAMRSPAISDPSNAGVPNSSRWARHWEAAPHGVPLSWSPRDRRLVNQWAFDHCHTLAGGTPILGLDMYEHSYHMDFGAKAASYVDTYGHYPLAKCRGNS